VSGGGQSGSQEEKDWKNTSVGNGGLQELKTVGGGGGGGGRGGGGGGGGGGGNDLRQKTEGKKRHDKGDLGGQWGDAKIGLTREWQQQK